MIAESKVCEEVQRVNRLNGRTILVDGGLDAALDVKRAPLIVGRLRLPLLDLVVLDLASTQLPPNAGGCPPVDGRVAQNGAELRVELALPQLCKQELGYRFGVPLASIVNARNAEPSRASHQQAHSARDKGLDSLEGLGAMDAPVGGEVVCDTIAIPQRVEDSHLVDKVRAAHVNAAHVVANVHRRTLCVLLVGG